MNAFNPVIEWPLPPPEAWPLLGSGVHLWAFGLDLSPSALLSMAATLCAEERSRAGRFHFDIHRDRFIAGRGALRTILGRYLRVEPTAIEFVYNPRGKPALADVAAQARLSFNLAHTGGLGLLAVARDQVVGVDVEEIRVLPEFDVLVDRFFSARESAAFLALSPADKPAAFFNLWTRKEAWLKATGEGIGELLNRVEVSFLPGDEARVLSLPPGWHGAISWRLVPLCPASGFAAALAYVGRQCPVRCWRWPGTDPIVA